MGSVAGTSGPRSPYKDSLAALHEIATSPQTFLPSSYGGGNGGGEGADADAASKGNKGAGASSMGSVLLRQTSLLPGIHSPLFTVSARVCVMGLWLEACHMTWVWIMSLCWKKKLGRLNVGLLECASF